MKLMIKNFSKIQGAKLAALGVLLISSLMLTGCGNRGDLYLPPSAVKQPVKNIN